MEFSNQIWLGGMENAQNGIQFNANIPSYEVFSGPNKRSVNGFVRGTKPMELYGEFVSDFWFKFKDGVVVEYSCERMDLMKRFLEQDEGSKFLGEVALVPFSSPIS